MRDVHVPNFRRRLRALVPACVVLLIGGFVLYGFFGRGWWMLAFFPVLVIVFVAAAWRQASVRCPHCGRFVYEQEHHEEGRPMVFLCRRCDTRLITDVPFPVPG